MICSLEKKYTVVRYSWKLYTDVSPATKFSQKRHHIKLFSVWNLGRVNSTIFEQGNIQFGPGFCITSAIPIHVISFRLEDQRFLDSRFPDLIRFRKVFGFYIETCWNWGLLDYPHDGFGPQYFLSADVWYENPFLPPSHMYILGLLLIWCGNVY